MADPERGTNLEKRKVTITVGGKPCSFYSDDSDDYIAALEERSNAVMKQTSAYSSTSGALLAVISLTDQLMRMEQAPATAQLSGSEQQNPKRRSPEPAESPEPTESPEPSKPSKTKQKRERKKEPVKMDRAQVSVWDILEA